MLQCLLISLLPLRHELCAVRPESRTFYAAAVARKLPLVPINDRGWMREGGSALRGSALIGFTPSLAVRFLQGVY